MAVRRESVRLELEDHFSTGMVKAAAATALLDKQLDHLSGSAVKTEGSTRRASSEIDVMTRSSNKADGSINQLTGRLRAAGDAASFLGPALVPISAVGIPAVTGLASALGFAVVGAGTAVLAFQGVGDTLKAVNKAALEPTTANLEAAHEAMAKLSPEAQGFVEQLRSMAPEVERLRDAAAAGLFPGLVEGLDGLLVAGPRVEKIITAISTELGDIAADAGNSLGSDRWAPFLDFVAEEGPSALSDFSAAAGNTVHALAELWMAFDPLNDDFSNWLVRTSEDFDRWAQELSQTDGFQEFVDYIETNGPQVADTLASVGNAVLQIVEAVAPLGGPSLKVIQAFADAIATIADSPLGTPIFGLVAILGAANTALRVMSNLNLKTFGGPAVAQMKGYAGGLLSVTTAQQRATMTARELAAAERARFAGLGKGAAVLGGLALVGSGAADSFGLTNTATLALAGSIAGPYGAAVGGAIGLVKDLNAVLGTSSDELDVYTQRILTLAGPGIADQLAAVNDAIAKQKDTMGSLNYGEKLGYNLSFGAFDPEGAGEAADKLKALEETKKGLEAQTKREAAAQEYANSAHGRAAASLQAQTDAMKVATTASHQQADAFIDISHNVDNAKVSLSDWITQLNQQASALQNFGANAKAASDKGLKQGLIADLKELGTAGAMRLKQLANATDAQIARANRAWVRGQRAIGQYDKAAKEAAKAKVLKVETDEAVARVRAFQNLIRGLPPISIPLVPRFVPGQSGGIDGDPKTKLADGGTVPGPRSPYGDRVLSLLAPTEEVITNRNGEADRFRADRAAGRIPAYADGGTVDNTPDSVLSNLYGSGGDSATDSNRKAAAKRRETAASDSAARALASLKAIVDRSSASIDKERAKRDELRSMKADLTSTVAGSFRSDLFGGGGNVWSSGADENAGTLGILRGDIANANQFKEVLKVLKAKGLSGDAFAEIAQSGDLNAARALAQSGDVQTFENLFNLRRTATNATGAFAGEARFGAELAIAQKQLIASVGIGKTLSHLAALAEKNPAQAGYYLAQAIRGAAPRRPKKGNQ